MYFSINMFAVPKPQQMLHRAIIFNLNLTKNCMLSTDKICGDVMYDFCTRLLQSWQKRRVLVGIWEHKVRQGHKKIVKYEYLKCLTVEK